MLRATGGLSAPNNSYLQAGAPGAGQLPAPIRYNGGRGAYGRPAGQPYQGAGGGGGGAGIVRARQGRSRAARWRGRPRRRSRRWRARPVRPRPRESRRRAGRRGGGGTWLAAGTGDALGGKGANGRVEINYLTAVVPMRTLLVHMPGPETPTTFAPLVYIGDGGNIPDGREYEVAHPQPAPTEKAEPFPAASRSATTARTPGSWSSPAAAADGTATPSPGISPCGSTSTTTGPPPGRIRPARLPRRSSAVPRFTGLVPANDPVVQAGFLILGTITLPLRWLPADNQSAYYTVSVDSTTGRTGSWTCCSSTKPGRPP